MRTSDPIADFVTGAWAFALGIAVLGFMLETISQKDRA